LAQLW